MEIHYIIKDCETQKYYNHDIRYYFKDMSIQMLFPKEDLAKSCLHAAKCDSETSDKSKIKVVPVKVELYEYKE